MGLSDLRGLPVSRPRSKSRRVADATCETDVARLALAIISPKLGMSVSGFNKENPKERKKELGKTHHAQSLATLD